MEEIRLKGGILMTPKDIQILTNCSARKARQEHLTLRDILGIKPKTLTVAAYCKYFGFDFNRVARYLNPYR